MTIYGWSFPDPFVPGQAVWDNLVNNYPQVAKLANIQCENCHGPGSDHNSDTTHSKMVSSLEAGACGQCHDEFGEPLPYVQWEPTLHANATSFPTGPDHSTCVKCHSGIGFIQFLNSSGQDSSETDYMPITCAVCHDPHSAANPFDIRTVSSVTLANGMAIASGGEGQLCMNCHRARQNAATYPSQYHPYFGPHDGPQTDVLEGVNAVTYGQTIGSSPHKDVVANSCVTCHMSEAPDSLTSNTLGGHSMAMRYALAPGDTVDNMTSCSGCHPGAASFADIGDVVFQVDSLISVLGNLLPPSGPSVVVDSTYTVPQLQAAYNYLLAVADNSHGIHNADFTEGILQASIANLISGITELPTPSLPLQFALHPNFPNPFNPATTLRFEVARPLEIKLNVYNLNGQVVARLVNKEMAPGSYQVTFDGTQLSSGIYLARLEGEGVDLRQKMILVK